MVFSRAKCASGRSGSSPAEVSSCRKTSPQTGNKTRGKRRNFAKTNIFRCFLPGKDAYDKEVICELAYKNDDLWYMFMAAQNGTRTIKTRKYHKIFSLIAGSQTVQMATENVVGNKNIEIMKILASHYPEAFNRILTDIS